MKNNSSAIILIADKYFQFLIKYQLIYFEEKHVICEWNSREKEFENKIEID